MLTASAIQYYWIYTEQIHYTRDLRTTAQNTILNTLGIVIGSLIKLFSVTQCLYYPCTCLPPQRDLQRLIYIQYKFYTSNLSQTSLGFSSFASSCFVTSSYAAVGSAQELSLDTLTGWVLPSLSVIIEDQGRVGTKSQHAIDLTQVLVIASQQKLSVLRREGIWGKQSVQRKDDRLRLGLKCATWFQNH